MLIHLVDYFILLDLSRAIGRAHMCDTHTRASSKRVTRVIKNYDQRTLRKDTPAALMND